MRSLLGAGVVAMGCLAGTGWAQSPPIDPVAPYWNPRRVVPGDLELPLPCGSGIALRPVPAPVGASPLADRLEAMGDADASIPYSEAVRQVYVAGSFGAGDAAHYWIGKYEITRGQYVAVMQGCDAHTAMPADQRRLPQASISWADAIRFTDAATLAVLKLDRNALPREAGSRAYIRLPTEAEWEYAARGASVVTREEFRQHLPPMDGPVTAYAQLTRVGRRTPPQPVGFLKPDRLGLYDMLGNVSEFVLDPYRLTRAERQGGRVGGPVARGGDINTSADFIRTSMRIEYSPFLEDGTPRVLQTLGFRIALGLQILDITADQSLRQAWTQETARDAEALSPDSDPQVLARRLEAAVTDPAQRRAIASLRGAVETERSRRAQAEERAVRTAIGAGAFLIREVRNDARILAGMEANLQDAEKLSGQRTLTSDEQRDLDDGRLGVARWRSARDTAFTLLSALILQQTEVQPKTLDNQLAVWRAENAQPEFEILRRLAGLFPIEVAAARPGRAVKRDEAFRRLMADAPAAPH